MFEDLDDIRLTTRGAARYTGYSVQHFRNSRSKGLGPPFHKIGSNRGFYWRSDLDEWMERLEKQAAEAARPAGLRNKKGEKKPKKKPDPSDPKTPPDGSEP